MNRASIITSAFGKAGDYDQHARVQRRIADDLAGTIAALPIVRRRGQALRLLEIGCGTGFLTEAMARQGVVGDWLVTDVAPEMVERCSTRMHATAPAARITYRSIDGQAPALPANAEFDLIVSSMAFQWFDDLEVALERLFGWLSPNGTVAFTTLLEGTFREWTTACHASGSRCAVRDFPDQHKLGNFLPSAVSSDIDVREYRDRHNDARSFLKGLKAIGAATPAAGTRPLPASRLRAAMAGFEAQGAIASYRVAQVILKKRKTSRQLCRPGLPSLGTIPSISKTYTRLETRP